MKKILIIAVLFVTSIGFSQNNLKVQTEKQGDLVEATYFHENGNIAQQGTFNAEGKLHGVWTSYDISGKKLSSGTYENGKKSGKWFFWTDTSLKEVDYSNSKILNVVEWNNSSKLAIRN